MMPYMTNHIFSPNTYEAVSEARTKAQDASTQKPR
jgi:hypothetical protein